MSEWASIEILCGALDRKCCVAHVLSGSLSLCVSALLIFFLSSTFYEVTQSTDLVLWTRDSTVTTVGEPLCGGS